MAMDCYSLGWRSCSAYHSFLIGPVGSGGVAPAGPQGKALAVGHTLLLRCFSDRTCGAGPEADVGSECNLIVRANHEPVIKMVCHALPVKCTALSAWGESDQDQSCNPFVGPGS